jgi:N-acetylglucosaminyl-diphospho-decaprenol L-rhamnosyltransferase
VNRSDVPRPSDPTAASGPGPLVSAVIVNYNAWHDVAVLVAALGSSAEVASGLCEVLVVDNASEGPVPEPLCHPEPGVRLIARRDNGGFAVGVNAGWHASRAPWLLLINPDVAAADGWLSRVVERVRGYESAAETGGGNAPGVVGFALRNPDGSRQPSVGRFPNLGRAVWEQLIPRSRRKYQAVWRTRAGPVDWVTGACMLVNARLLEALGGLDEEFFLYYEEVALCRSAHRLGWRVEYDPCVEVVHLRPLQNREVTPRMRVITRHSKLLYFRKHLPRWQFLGLSAVVAAEARLRGAWARLLGRAEEVRSWQTVARVERELRSGAALGGRAVLALADAVVEPEPGSDTVKAPVTRPAALTRAEARARSRRGA